MCLKEGGGGFILWRSLLGFSAALFLLPYVISNLTKGLFSACATVPLHKAAFVVGLILYVRDHALNIKQIISGSPRAFYNRVRIPPNLIPVL